MKTLKIDKLQDWLFSDGIRLFELITVSIIGIMVTVTLLGGLQSSLSAAMYQNYPQLTPVMLFTFAAASVTIFILSWISNSYLLDIISALLLALVGAIFMIVGSAMTQYAPPWNMSMIQFTVWGLLCALAADEKIDRCKAAQTKGKYD